MPPMFPQCRPKEKPHRGALDRERARALQVSNTKAESGWKGAAALRLAQQMRAAYGPHRFDRTGSIAR
jgi:hypothetical protein